MARYTGPKVRLSRRLSTNLFENEKGRKALERRPFPPGTHGRTRRRNKRRARAARPQQLPLSMTLTIRARIPRAGCRRI